MNLSEIHGRLKERFDTAIADLQAPEAGDGWIQIAPPAFHEVCRLLKEEPELGFDFLRLISAVDWSDRFSSVYHLYSYRHRHSVVLHVDLDRQDPRLASVTDLWPTADWHEREAYDLMGIVFEGHPELRRIFLPDDWQGFPLRKDYQQPVSYHGISNE